MARYCGLIPFLGVRPNSSALPRRKSICASPPPSPYRDPPSPAPASAYPSRSASPPRSPSSLPASAAAARLRPPSEVFPLRCSKPARSLDSRARSGQPGHPPRAALVEIYLTVDGVAANPVLISIQHTKQREWAAIVARHLLLALVRTTLAAQDLQGFYTGRLLDYARAPDVQQLVQKNCTSPFAVLSRKKHYQFDVPFTSFAAAQALQRQASLPLPPATNRLLLGTSDNFAMEFSPK